MNVRTVITVAVAALAPLSAHAGAPSGEFYEVFAPAAATSNHQPTPQFARSEHRNYVEVTVAELVGDSADRRTREQTRGELAGMPLPVIGA
jgi:hypothetical protein